MELLRSFEAAEAFVRQLSFIGGEVPAIVAEMFSSGIRFHDPDGPEAEASADLDVVEFVNSFG